MKRILEEGGRMKGWQIEEDLGRRWRKTMRIQGDIWWVAPLRNRILTVTTETMVERATRI
jgi:hypothetical protein